MLKHDTENRGLKRRLFWTVGILTITIAFAIPIAVWTTVDRAGKSFWVQVQADLEADGETPHLTHLDYPVAGSDEENYCSNPLLDGIAGPHGATQLERLKSILPSRQFSSHYPQSNGPHPALGRTNLWQWSNWMWDAAARESDRSRGAPTPHLPPRELNRGSPEKRIANYFSHSGSTLSQFHEGNERKYAVFGPTKPERSWAYPTGEGLYLQTDGISSAATALFLDAVVNARSGNREATLRSMRTLSRITEATANERDLGTYWLSAQFLLLLETALVETLRESLWSNQPESLEQLKEMLNRVDLIATGGEATRENICSTSGLIGWCSTPGGRRYCTRDADNGLKLIVRVAPQGWFENQQGVLASNANHHLFAVLRGNPNFGDLIDASIAYDTALSSPTLNISHHAIALYRQHMSEIHLAAACAEAYRRMAIVAIALELYAIDHGGKIPSSLSELVPDYLDEIPADPMDGSPLRFRRTSATAFQLWSIALDRSDDNGHLNLTPNRSSRVDPGFRTYIGDWPWPSIP